MTDWRRRAAALADELTARGTLRSPGWVAAVREVPRHVLVPRYLEQAPETGEWLERESAADGLSKVYSDTGLYTTLGNGGPWLGETIPISSSSMPG